MNRTAIKKWIIYAATGLMLMLIREFVFGRFKLLNVYPVFGGLIVATVAMFEGGIGGASFGLLVGIVKDAALIRGEGFYALTYMICGGLTGVMCRYLFRNKFATALLWSFVTTAFTTLTYFTIFFLIPRRADISAFWTVALPEIFYSIILLPIVYYPIRHIYGSYGPNQD